MATVGFALTRPWGLYDDGEYASKREPIRTDSGVVDLPIGCGLSIVASDGLKLRFEGRRMVPAQPEGGAFDWTGSKRFWTIPVGATSDAQRFRVSVVAESGISQVIDVVLRGALARPDRVDESSSGGRLLALVNAIGERIRSLTDDNGGLEGVLTYEAVGRKLIASGVPWPVATRKWCESYDVEHPPPLDLIVRHAETLARLVERLAHHPRRVLARVRERLPANRVQELDHACLTWYVRQPGRSTAEKAGARQVILAVSRHENLDTLENRVLRHYLELAAGAARLYANLHRRLRASERLITVMRYERLCRTLAGDLAEVGVRLPANSVVPNYVLTQDLGYSAVWLAYQDILRRREEEDDVWRWQVRLWADCVRLSVLVALRSLSGAQVIAEAPLLIRADQERGRWADLPPHPLVVVIPADERQLVVTVIDAQDPLGNQFGPRELWPYFWSIGPASILHAQDLASGEETWVAVWSLHPLDGRELDLDKEAHSADCAIENVVRKLRLEQAVACRLRGVIIGSAVNGAVAEGGANVTFAYRCPVSSESLSGLVDTLAGVLPIIFGA